MVGHHNWQKKSKPWKAGGFRQLGRYGIHLFCTHIFMSLFKLYTLYLLTIFTLASLSFQMKAVQILRLVRAMFLWSFAF